MSQDLALPSAEMPIIDESRLMEEFGGDQEILAELKALFLERVPPLFDAIQEAAAAGNMEGLAREIHGLKGACATYGAPRLTQVCKGMEMLARGGDLVSIQANMNVLQDEFEKVLDAVKESVSV